MVVYITPAEGNGGILQFSTTITRETKKFCDCQLFVPDTVDDKFLVEVSECVQKYTKVKTINGNNKQIFELCRRVMANKPEKVKAGIVEGRVSKSLKDMCLVDQEFFLDTNMKCGDYLKSNGASVLKFVKYVVGEGIEKKEDNFAAEVAAAAFGK